MSDCAMPRGQRTNIATSIGLGFGTAWMSIGVLGLSPSNRVVAICAVLLAALALRFAVRRPSPNVVAHPPADLRILKWSIGLEVLGIAASLAYGIAMNRGDLILPLVGCAVGLHFLPLARAFHRPVLVLTGLLVTLAAAISTALAEPGRLGLIGFGAGLSIWGTLLISAYANPT